MGVVADAHPIRIRSGGIQHIHTELCAISSIPLVLPVHLCEEKLRLADERLRCCLALLPLLVSRF